jgi:hypothetical protein
MKPVVDHSLLTQTEQITTDSVELDNLLNKLSQSADDKAIDRVIDLYKKTILKLEQDIWQQEPEPADIENYQNAFKILEKLYLLRSVDKRHHFKIVIPVADRPQHLKQCLSSLLNLCEKYAYGGIDNNYFNKISVLIADDSKDQENIALHQNYCTELNNNGIRTEYFGLTEQLALTRQVLTKQPHLSKIISSVEHIKNTADFSHKGASIMRNITYLKLKQSSSCENDNNTLFYFIDSDQEFCINPTQGAENLYAINYFHYLDEIFKTKDIDILTGKVVGDPPVSPSVMAGRFQQDIQNFLSTIKSFNPEATCRFHQHEFILKDDAAYHDMANLFGFSDHKQAFDYHCSLPGKHNNIDCFFDFASKMNSFFYGEHPTRKTFFNYENGFSETTEARTVYTGNYVIKPETLEHFIPFATLKLRMAGPILGRMLKNRLGKKFVSANLPMLHKRTVQLTGESEFRAGVDTSNDKVDLTNEFIRQFFGDIALFSMQKITDQQFPDTTLSSDDIQTIIESTYQDIRKNYIEKHNTILQLKNQIQKNLNESDAWWNTNDNSNIGNSDLKLKRSRSNINRFLDNIQFNFDENTHAYQTITRQGDAEFYLSNILQSILDYQTDIDNWKQALARQ